MMEVVGGVLLTYIFVGEYPGTMGIIGTILTTLAVVINGVGNGVLEKRRMKNHNAAGVVHVLKKEVTTEKKKEKETKDKEKEEEVELGVELGGVELRVETKKRSREERRESSSRGEIEINVR